MIHNKVQHKIICIIIYPLYKCVRNRTGKKNQINSVFGHTYYLAPKPRSGWNLPHRHTSGCKPHTEWSGIWAASQKGCSNCKSSATLAHQRAWCVCLPTVMSWGIYQFCLGSQGNPLQLLHNLQMPWDFFIHIHSQKCTSLACVCPHSRSWTFSLIPPPNKDWNWDLCCMKR